MKQEKITQWHVHLTVECPHCEGYFDFSLTEDWISGFSGVEFFEEAKDVKCSECPLCKQQFTFDVAGGAI